jgi:hypothetical protein
MNAQLKRCIHDFWRGGMNTTHEPVAGNWYANKTGKLFKVKLISLNNNVPENIMLEYLDGCRTIITNTDWQCLHLNLPGADKKNTKAAYQS